MCVLSKKLAPDYFENCFWRKARFSGHMCRALRSTASKTCRGLRSTNSDAVMYQVVWCWQLHISGPMAYLLTIVSTFEHDSGHVCS